MKQSKDQLCLEILGKSNNGIENGVIEEGAAKSRQVEEFSSGEKLSSLSWGSGRDNALLDNIVEKRDQELFQECSEHLDAINQSTQLQQVINNEMRSQAEVRRPELVVVGQSGDVILEGSGCFTYGSTSSLVRK